MLVTEKYYLDCACNSMEHTMRFAYFDDDDPLDGLLYVHTYLPRATFWRRLKHGLKYIFGYQCRYGAFEETLLSPAAVQHLMAFLAAFQAKYANTQPPVVL